LLGRAIESALAQASPDIEILVSDNGSTDDTQAVIERYAGRGLRTFRHAKTMSAPKHGTFLMEQARGEFFLGLSDDDFLEPEFAAEVLAAFDRNPELAFVYTGCAVHYEDRQVPALVGPAVEPGTTFLAEHYAGRREVSWCACVTRVKDLRELGPQPEDRIMGDMFFWTKLAFKGPVGCVPQVLSHYILLRSNNDNISHGTAPAVWAHDSQTTVDEVFALARQTGADAEYVSRLREDTRRYVARSAANQFIWNRIRGASPVQAWGWIANCIPYLSSSPTAWVRVAAASLAPRSMLRNQLLSAAAKLAETRKVQLAATGTLKSNIACPAHQ
jgi:glycosyltransferase involved in cell wall biosynthesis